MEARFLQKAGAIQLPPRCDSACPPNPACAQGVEDVRDHPRPQPVFAPLVADGHPQELDSPRFGSGTDHDGCSRFLVATGAGLVESVHLVGSPDAIRIATGVCFGLAQEEQRQLATLTTGQ